jgi:hypothetical protein
MDTLHQFFPDVLYTDRFQIRPREFFGYIQAQAQRHFPQFEAGRADYNRTNRAATTDLSGNTIAAATTAAATAATTTAPTARETLSAYVSTITGPYDSSGEELEGANTNYTSVFQHLLGYTTPTRSRRQYIRAPLLQNVLLTEDHLYYTPTSNMFSDLLTMLNPMPLAPMENVIVFPSNEQIAAATRVYSAQSRLEECCAVCQEDIEPSAEVRQIKQCTHVFHRDCVDQWFEQSVFCPICRLDIRESV